VNKERQTDHLAHSLLSANVLDDPRWEKLALGTASPEEIESLRAWAQHSYMARRAWDLFRPAMEKEKAAITVAVLERRMVAVHNVGEPNFGEQTVRRGLPSEADVQAKPIDARMMSRHARREPVGLVVDAARVMAVASSEFMAPLGMKVCRTEPVRSSVEPDMVRAAADEPTKREKITLGVTSRSRAVLREACGTTSSVGVVCRDIVDTSSVGAVASTLAELPPVEPRRRVWDAQWLVLGATALYMTLVVIAGAMVWKGKHTLTTSSSNAPPGASSVEPSFEVRPGTTVPAKTADDKFHYAKPALSVSSLPAGAVSAQRTTPTSSATNPRPQAKSLSAPIPMVKRKPVYKEVCTGVGLFQRCKKVLVESVPEASASPDISAFGH
jgi:hypothetical protein